jgi:hypothetical protein
MSCLYCAYPKLDYTPPVELDVPAHEVHAFRMDITTGSGLFLRGLIDVPPDQLWKCEEFVVSRRLTELAATPTDKIPAQLKTSVSYGLFFPFLVVNMFTHRTHTVFATLYRPGYELVEVHSWEKAKSVLWQPVPGIEDQEKVLDQLLTSPLAAGSVSRAHRQAMLFGASEYDRLAVSVRSCESLERLKAKANKLREQAEK